MNQTEVRHHLHPKRNFAFLLPSTCASSHHHARHILSSCRRHFTYPTGQLIPHRSTASSSSSSSLFGSTINFSAMPNSIGYPSISSPTQTPQQKQSRNLTATNMSISTSSNGSSTNSNSNPLDDINRLHETWLPHRLNPSIPIVGPGDDWITPIYSALETARSFRPAQEQFSHPPRILVLYGTLRPEGFSKLLSYECARLGETLGMEMRVFNPSGLPVRDPELQDHPKVVELRSLVDWSEGHVWVGAELHGSLCSTFKNQIDWIPLNSGSIRPTQGKSCVVLQVCGGSQSFNVVNALRLLARWMRMSCVVNQSSVPMAWKQFNDDGRMKDSSLRDRVVDVMEEFVKTIRINREYSDIVTDRFSERKEKEEKGKLLTQAEKEAEKEAAAVNKANSNSN